MKNVVITLAALAILCLTFFAGRATAPQSNQEDAIPSAGVSSVPPEFTNLLQKFETVSSKPYAEMSQDERNFIGDTMTEYKLECMPANDENRSLCRRFDAAVRAHNDTNQRARINALLVNSKS